MRTVLAVAAYFAAGPGLLWLANLVGPKLPWLWWQHTNATVLQCQEMVIPGKSPTALDHCIVGWNHRIAVMPTGQGYVYRNVTDHGTLDWAPGAHPAGTTVAIGVRGNTAATVNAITDQGIQAAFMLLIFVVAIIAALIWFSWRRSRRRAHHTASQTPGGPFA